MTDDRPLLRVESISVQNYRGFESLDVTLQPGLTVLIGENGSGKTNLLGAIATLLAGLWGKAPLNLDARDAFEPEVQPSMSRQGRYPVRLSARMQLLGEPHEIARSLQTPDGRTTNAELKTVRDTFANLIQNASSPWPLVAWYGTQRLHDRARESVRKRPKPGRREDGWTDCLDPRSSEEQLLQWWFEASLPKLQGSPCPAHDALVRALGAAVARPLADGGVDSINAVDLELPEGLPVFRFASGRAVRWAQLSDGYHIFLGLVGDLARRAWILNSGILEDPIAEAEGVVLIDELDLHIHPRWQATAVESLRRVFPRVQFVITTHSPLVLAGARNEEVRALAAGALVRGVPLVHGRDPNSIYETVLGLSTRPAWVRERLAEIATLVDDGDERNALERIRTLEEEWGTDDRELVRLRAWLG